MIQKEKDTGKGYTPEAHKAAAIMTIMEMGALLGTYEKSLQTPQIEELREILDAPEKKARFEKLMTTFKNAQGHGVLKLITEPFMYNGLPENIVGECQQTLFILSVGATVHESSRATRFVQGHFLGQCSKIADELGKDPSDLNLGDLGEAILSGKFDPAPELPEEYR